MLLSCPWDAVVEAGVALVEAGVAVVVGRPSHQDWCQENEFGSLMSNYLLKGSVID